jgi:hypothetical protein
MQTSSAANMDQVSVGQVKQQFSVHNLSSGGRILGIALAVGLAADVLFYRQSLGLSAPLFAALMIGGLLLALASEARAGSRVRRNVWLAVPTLFFAAMIFLRDEPGLTFMNLVATLLLLGIIFFTLGSNPTERLTVMAYPIAVCVAGILTSFSAWPLAGYVLSRLNSRQRSVGVAARVVLGLLIALPFLALFAALFSSADAVFAQGVRNVFDFDLLKNLPDLVGQTIWIGFVAWFCGGALLMALERARHPSGMLNLEKPITPFVRLGFVESATVLASMNALFAVFVAIQFTYLFGGSANVQVGAFTYADYARRGFFELVAVAVVTMGLLLALDWIAKRDTGRQVTGLKTLSLLLVALVLVILASAFQRMSLYESAYGFTSLRLYTHWFMLWMGAVFALKTAAIVLERGQIFAFGGFLSLIVALAGINLLNPDAFIAEQNIQRYLATGTLSGDTSSAGVSRSGGLDTGYLTDMSADAVPVIMAHFSEFKGAGRERIGSAMRYQLDALYRRLDGAGWPSYQLSRKQAIDALLAQRDTLNQFKPRTPRSLD